MDNIKVGDPAGLQPNSLRRKAMIFKEKLSDYTEQEFLDFLSEIDRANENEPEEALVPLLQHFRKITEHPAGTDLLYWPESNEAGEPEQILIIVKEWRRANGKDGFKPS
ncbi:bacteriocin immunity protein [Pseudomonas guariconensis]|uniref:bacteriocin immunity protein n=1 Tax=Pseudomonas TaxID=286 RepID=UPI00397DE5C6